MGKDTVILSLILFNIFFIAFIGAIIVFIRQYKIKKRTHSKELETVELIHKEELLKAQTEIQKETMNYIGREIHDNVGQKLTLSSLYLQQLILENQTPQLNENIDNVNNIINESLIELRHLSKSLTDDIIQNNSLVELIQAECNKIKQLKKCNISFVNSLNLDLTSYQVKSIILRIIQEFIQNSLKHSKCKQIEIDLSNLSNEITILLKDDGVGFNVEKKIANGIGLNNIKKRVEVLDGEFNLQSNSKGTTLNLKICV
jgi:signal transduction histidine kinase